MEKMNDRIGDLDSDSIGFVQKSAVGSHSYTPQETKTMSFIDKEILKKQINGEPLELKNDGKTRYFLVEDGTVFKCSVDGLFYQLDLETMKWHLNQGLASLYYDSYLRFQELVNFKDYYDVDDELDLGSGRHL